jgi:hypothetical protein
LDAAAIRTNLSSSERGDDEATHDTSRQMTVLASVFMTGMRLQRMFQT